MRKATRISNVHRSDWNRLARLYDLEGYLFQVVSPRFHRDQTLSPYDFFAIIIWKSNRSKTRIKRGLKVVGKMPSQLMRQVSQAPNPLDKLDVLLQIPEIGLAIASAILTVCYPEQFTVLDYRAWETINGMAVSGLPRRYPQNCQEYLQYCRACQQLAGQVGFSLRDLDRALWAKSWEDDLKELISSETQTPAAGGEDPGQTEGEVSEE